MSNLKDRIKAIRTHFNISNQRDLGNAIGVNEARIKSLETGRVKEVSANELSQLVKNFNISMDWLLAGKGKMLPSDEDHIVEMTSYFRVPTLEAVAVMLGYSESEASVWRSKGIPRSVLGKFKTRKLNDEGKKQGDEEIKQQLNGNYTIDLLSVKAGAGKGIYNYEVEVIDRVVIDSIFFKNKPDLKSIKIIAVDGDSMEPNIKDGSYVIIDESKTTKVNGIYALQLDGQLLIKRLQFMLDGTVKIISDNPKYETEIYNEKDTQIPCHIIGRKVLTIQ